MNRFPALFNFLIFSAIAFSGCAHSHSFTHERDPSAISYADNPILQALKKNGQKFSHETKKWEENWSDLNLEQTDVYHFPALSGSTSVNLKIEKTDASGTTKLGIFLPPNDSGNPTAELAYFNMAAILGWDNLVRPAARYQLGPKASKIFSDLISAGFVNGKVSSDQKSNAENILQLIASGNPLPGCLKAAKDKTDIALDSMSTASGGDNGDPLLTFPVMASLQITHPAPLANTPLTLTAGYTGDARELALEYSVIMTLDTIFEQGDRYSGGNLGIWKTPDGVAHFHSTDNGGAYLQESSDAVTLNLNWFSRYDHPSVDTLREINQFLLGKKSTYLGYADPVQFVTDLGFYFEMPPKDSTRLLERNIQMFLDKVDSVVAAHGSDAYLN